MIQQNLDVLKSTKFLRNYSLIYGNKYLKCANQKCIRRYKNIVSHFK